MPSSVPDISLWMSWRKL